MRYAVSIVSLLFAGCSRGPTKIPGLEVQHKIQVDHQEVRVEDAKSKDATKSPPAEPMQVQLADNRSFGEALALVKDLQWNPKADVQLAVNDFATLVYMNGILVKGVSASVPADMRLLTPMRSPTSGVRLVADVNAGKMAGLTVEGTEKYFVFIGPANGRRELLECRAGTDYFISTDSNCEGKERVSALGFVDTTRRADLKPIVRCYDGKNGLHHVTRAEANCASQYSANAEGEVGRGL